MADDDTYQPRKEGGEECPICRCGMDWQCINLDTGRSVYWCRICLFQRVLK